MNITFQCGIRNPDWGTNLYMAVSFRASKKPTKLKNVKNSLSFDFLKFEYVTYVNIKQYRGNPIALWLKICQINQNI